MTAPQVPRDDNGEAGAAPTAAAAAAAAANATTIIMPPTILGPRFLFPPRPSLLPSGDSFAAAEYLFCTPSSGREGGTLIREAFIVPAGTTALDECLRRVAHPRKITLAQGKGRRCRRQFHSSADSERNWNRRASSTSFPFFRAQGRLTSRDMVRRQWGPGAVSVEAAVLFLLAVAAASPARAQPLATLTSSPSTPTSSSPTQTSTSTSAASPSAADVAEVSPVPELAAVPVLSQYPSSDAGLNTSATAPTHGVRDTCSGMFSKGLVAGPVSSVIKYGSLWVYPHTDDGDGNPAPPITAKRSSTLDECASECENEGAASVLSNGILACQFSFCPPDSTGSNFTKIRGSGNGSTKPALLPGCPDGYGGPMIPPGQCRFSFESISLHRLHVLQVPTPIPDASPTTVISGEHVRLATKAYLATAVKGYTSLVRRARACLC